MRSMGMGPALDGGMPLDAPIATQGCVCMGMNERDREGDGHEGVKRQPINRGRAGVAS